MFCWEPHRSKTFGPQRQRPYTSTSISQQIKQAGGAVPNRQPRVQRVCARATESDNQVWLIVIIVSGFVMWCFNKSLPVLPFAPLRRAEISFVYLLITFRRDHAVFDADHALLPGPVPRHPGDRASEAHPVQEVSGRRGGAERAVACIFVGDSGCRGTWCSCCEVRFYPPVEKETEMTR